MCLTSLLESLQLPQIIIFGLANTLDIIIDLTKDRPKIILEGVTPPIIIRTTLRIWRTGIIADTKVESI